MEIISALTTLTTEEILKGVSVKEALTNSVAIGTKLKSPLGTQAVITNISVSPTNKTTDIEYTTDGGKKLKKSFKSQQEIEDFLKSVEVS